jgi:hypothetical protein
MTTVTHKLIPWGSYELRVFAGEDVPDESDIETVLVLENRGDGVCEMALAHGHLYDEANVLIGLKAWELGFKVLEFSALKGKTVSRWAELVRTTDKFDFYRVDIEAAITKIGESL